LGERDLAGGEKRGARERERERERERRKSKKEKERESWVESQMASVSC
jgi:hypothetical protein